MWLQANICNKKPSQIKISVKSATHSSQAREGKRLSLDNSYSHNRLFIKDLGIPVLFLIKYSLKIHSILVLFLKKLFTPHPLSQTFLA